MNYFSLTSWARPNNVPPLKDVHVLILQICATLQGQRDFPDMIKLRILI